MILLKINPYLFPEAMNQVCFLQGLNVVVFLVDPMMGEFSILEEKYS